MSDTEKRDAFVENIISKMTLKQLVGGCFIMDFMGSTITPYTETLVKDFNVAGLRVNTRYRGKPSYASTETTPEMKLYRKRTERAPKGLVKDFTYNVAPSCSPEHYAEVLNKIRDMAAERPLGIPLHFTLDQEGNGTENYGEGDIRLFPPAMGLTATGSPALTERVAESISKQLRGVGVNWVHGPVLDVNTDPRNPEIGVRSFSDNAADVTKYAMAFFKGCRKHNIITTGKHFPGRGESSVDSHLVCPAVNLTKEELLEKHIKPYKALIKAGLPAIMIAHTIYPALDESGLPATVSKKIVTDFLKGELGFKGVVTTDNIFMRGIVAKYGLAEASIRALLAGQDLILFRNEDTMAEEGFNKLLKAAESGRIPVSRLRDANRRILKMKYDYGLFENYGKVDASKASVPQHDALVIKTEKEAAAKAVNVKNTNKVLPLKKSEKVLLVEMIHTTHIMLNNTQNHAQIFWEVMQDIAPNVYGVEIKRDDAETRRRISRRLKEADTVIVTMWLGHRAGARTGKLVDWLLKKKKKVIVVTDSPYPCLKSSKYTTVVNVYSGNCESLRVAGEVIFGKRKAGAKLPVKDS